MGWCGVAGACSLIAILPSVRDGPSMEVGGRSEILAVANLLHHLANPAVAVDLLQEILRGHEAVVEPLPRRMHLLLEGPPRDLRDLGAAHPAHGREHRAVVDLGEELAPGCRLGALPGQLEDPLLGGA